MANLPARIPLYAPLATRDADFAKDSRLYNGYVERGIDDSEVWVCKRPGQGLYAVVAANQAGQGVFNWNNNIYSIFGGHLYKDGVDKGAVDATSTYTFTSVLGATPRLFFKNEVAAYSYDDGAGIVHVVDADYPATTTRGCVYLDGTLYVLDSLSRVVGSDLNDPQAWDPLNFLYVQIEPDPPKAITKQLVYVVALKSTETEVFYDAGNATGSPLGQVAGSKLGVGCRAPGSLCHLGDDIVWVGTTTEGGSQVMLMSRVHGETISTPAIERLLSPLDYTTTWSWSAKVSGHRFYVVTIVNANLTVVYDLTAKAWYIWTDPDGNYMPYVASTYTVDGTVILQHATNGNLYSFAATQNYDINGASIPVTIYTPNVDGGARATKASARVEVVGDRVFNGTLNVSWSDDDYNTYSTPVAVNLYQDRPFFQDGSGFSQRSYKLEYSGDNFMRIKALEMVISPGTS